MYFIGIDTSCYTTSIAVLNEKKELIYDGRVILEVPAGEAGLRQSEAVFQHINNLGKLSTEAFKEIDPEQIAGIAASKKPRNCEESYMPVFMAGYNSALLLGNCFHRQIFEVSHQENHVLAGMLSAKTEFNDRFLAYHISGGTTELLQVMNKDEMRIDIIGGSQDLKAGQFIDRVGVKLGIKFPCGKEMDSLCGEDIDAFKSTEQMTKAMTVPISVNGLYTSFSGPESHVQRLISRGDYDAGKLSMGVFLCIARSIEATLVNAVKAVHINQVLMVGGVASNRIIRNYLSHSKKIKSNAIEVIFADARHSSDNAIGTAYYGLLHSLAVEV